VPQWLQHTFLMNPTVDADLVLLHPAEHLIRRQALQGGRASAWRQ
jgi:hypothetical protein